MSPALEALQLVPLARLILHESRDERRLALLRERMQKEGVQRNPVIVAPREEGCLVLDGAHRVHALGELGCELALVQLVEPSLPAEGWGHLIDDSGLRGLREIEGVSISEEPGDGWLAGVNTGDREQLFVRAREDGLAAEVRALWRLQELYPGDEVVSRVSPEALVEPSPGQAVIRYRSFSPGELVEIVRSGEVLPAGITRFRISERVLGVHYPLTEMRSGEREARNAGLRRFIEKRKEENRIRRYEEPVVLFE